MTCGKPHKAYVTQLSFATQLAAGQGDAALRCRNPKCNLPLKKDGTCPRGCRQEDAGAAEERLRCKNPNCRRTLKKDGTCPRGCRQDTDWTSEDHASYLLDDTIGAEAKEHMLAVERQVWEEGGWNEPLDPDAPDAYCARMTDVPLAPTCPRCGASLPFLGCPHGAEAGQWCGGQQDVDLATLPDDLEREVAYLYMHYPSLFGRTPWARWHILQHLIAGYGNGREWEAGGLVDIFQEERDRPPGWEHVPPRQWRDVRGMPRYSTSSPSATHLANIPDDVQPAWARGAWEALAMMWFIGDSPYDGESGQKLRRGSGRDPGPQTHGGNLPAVPSILQRLREVYPEGERAVESMLWHAAKRQELLETGDERLWAAYPRALSPEVDTIAGEPDLAATLARATAAGDRLGAMRAWAALARSYEEQQEWLLARNSYQPLLTMQRELGDHRGQVDTLLQLAGNALVLEDKGLGEYAGGQRDPEEPPDITAARAYCQEALAIATQERDDWMLARAWWTMSEVAGAGEWYTEARDGRVRARDLVERVLPVRRKAGDQEALAEALDLAGRVYSAVEDRPQAFATFQELVRVQQQRGDAEGTRGAQGWLAVAALHLGRQVGPADDTRAASVAGGQGTNYADMVDRGPHPVTRLGACQHGDAALAYARRIDRGYHPDTWAVVRGTRWEKEYRQRFGDQVPAEEAS